MTRQRAPQSNISIDDDLSRVFMQSNLKRLRFKLVLASITDENHTDSNDKK